MIKRIEFSCSCIIEFNPTRTLQIPFSIIVVGSLCPSICPSATLLGCLVCVICNSERFHSFIFKLCIMFIHTLKMCTFFFCAHFMNIFSYLRCVELRHFQSNMLRWCLVCVICNSNTFHSFTFKHCMFTY